MRIEYLIFLSLLFISACTSHKNENENLPSRIKIDTGYVISDGAGYKFIPSKNLNKNKPYESFLNNDIENGFELGSDSKDLKAIEDYGISFIDSLAIKNEWAPPLRRILIIPIEIIYETDSAIFNSFRYIHGDRIFLYMQKRIHIYYNIFPVKIYALNPLLAKEHFGWTWVD